MILLQIVKNLLPQANAPPFSVKEVNASLLREGFAMRYLQAGGVVVGRLERGSGSYLSRFKGSIKPGQYHRQDAL